ncbi:hypothetical protein F5884DRAFT_884188 [Xylogone sp. PMI_703]|nr:hypothetical protein F5884DRAFT_884188 [Xylogone sp. PMI_703]
MIHSETSSHSLFVPLQQFSSQLQRPQLPSDARGCGTCRSRKVKCGREKPECQRCFTTGRKCSGYNVDYGFVVTTSSTWSRHPSSKAVASDHAQERPRSAKNRASINRDIIQRQEPRLCVIPNQRAVSCELFIGMFMDLFLPRGRQITDRMISLPGGWLCLLPTLFHGQYEVLTQSLLALYTGYVGSRNGDSGLLSRGIELYGNALQGVNDNIGAKLATTMVLSRCELLLAQGGMELIKQFGSRLPSNELIKLIVKKYRCLAFYEGCRHRRASFMVYPPYNKLSTAVPSDPDYFAQRLFEKMLWVPALIEQADRLDVLQFTTDKEVRQGRLMIKDLLNFALKLENHLTQYYSEICQSAQSPRFTPLETSKHSNFPKYRLKVPTQSTDSKYRLLYANNEDSYLWILYWGVAISLYDPVKQLHARYTKLEELFPGSDPLPQDLIALNKDDSVIDQICRQYRWVVIFRP